MTATKLGLPGVVQVSTLQIPSICSVLYRKHKVGFFIGKPGTGKTAGIIAGWKDFNKSFLAEGGRWVDTPTLMDLLDPKVATIIRLYASSIEEIDANGMPHIELLPDGTRVTVYTNTIKIPAFAKARVLVLLDEFPNGRTQVQNALQSIILERRVGEYKIPENVYFVCAGNRPQDNCGTFYIPSALRNRVFWFECDGPTIKEWFQLMRSINQPIDPRLEGFFLSVGAEFLNTFNPKSEMYAYDTDRSRHMISEVISDINDPEMIRLLAGGAGGAGLGDALQKFIEMTDKIDMKEILDHPTTIKRYIHDRGLLYAICVNMIEKFLEKTNSEKVIKALMEIGEDEYHLFVVKSAIDRKKSPAVIAILQSSTFLTEYAKKFLPMLTALKEEMK